MSGIFKLWQISIILLYFKRGRGKGAFIRIDTVIQMLIHNAVLLVTM